jgi:hypothetical protein
MTTLSDDFSTDNASRWTEIVGTALVWNASGYYEITSATDGVAVYNTGTGTATHWGKVRLTAATGFGGLVLRSTGTASDLYYYVASQGGGNVWLIVGNASGWMEDMVSASMTIAQNDYIAATVTGTGTSTVVRVWKNPANATPAAVDGWDSAGDTADATLSLSGYVGDNFANAGQQAGVGFWAVSAYDNWSAGDFTVGGASAIKTILATQRRMRIG